MPIVLIAASAAAAIIHFALGPEHVEELGALGVGFYVAGVLQLAWALVAAFVWRRGVDTLARSGRALAGLGIGLHGAILLAWIVSRTIGLPAGEQPWVPEALGTSDGITALLEIGLVVALLTRLRRPLRDAATLGARTPGAEVPREATSLVGAAPVLALILMATVAAVSAEHAHADGMPHDGDAHAAEMGTGHTH